MPTTSTPACLVGTILIPLFHKFTGKERDAESGLDEFGARYYSSSLGRFTTADWAAKPTSVPYAEFGDPQSLNLYSYVRNNPLNRVDADGHCWPFCEVVSWVATHIAQVGIGISSTRSEYNEPRRKSMTTLPKRSLTSQSRSDHASGGAT